jgi:hypothetical protein
MAQAKDVRVGQVWTARVSGRDVRVRVEAELPSSGRKLFSLLNLSTNRPAKGTAGKLKRLVSEAAAPTPMPGPSAPPPRRVSTAPQDYGRGMHAPESSYGIDDPIDDWSAPPHPSAAHAGGFDPALLVRQVESLPGPLPRREAAFGVAERVMGRPLMPPEREAFGAQWAHNPTPRLESLRGQLPPPPRRAPPRQNPSAYPSQLAAATAHAIARSDGSLEGIVAAVRGVLRI